MITRACRQQSQSEGINHVKQTPTNPNAKPSPEKSHHNPIKEKKKKTTCNSNGRCSNNKPKETARLQANDEQDAKGTSSDCQWATSTRNQEQKNRWTDQLATPHRVDESIDPNYFRYFSKYFGSNQPTRSNAVHSLLALLTSILQACWASVLRNSLPMASARTRASKMRRLLHR